MRNKRHLRHRTVPATAALITALILLGCARPSGTLAQAQSAASLGADLLNAAPAGPSRPDRMDEARFLTAFENYRTLIDGLPETRVSNWVDAVNVLESYLAMYGPVIAHVQTDPDGHEVTYRRIYENRSPSNPGVTSNDSVTLTVPADYWFDSINPYTGEVETRRRECRFGCSVKFVFRPDDRDAR